ncbi:M56 family metallopeptidase [Autumnicola psychrophila]|uniref:M56 family metallopeptidase n=1 Tax=Autumnicola psychrophila TaxID=3075592 RepID=A0ABU3DPV7_9FLAO|nr:M56 family metallopeptidase [Zunongwangia sp. F225]MDT0685648.1 M56 family metallopeptidase [Zunongwangia sp. F225]
MHHFKRFYLLGTLFLSFSIPLITISYTVEPVEIPSYTQEAVVFRQDVENGNFQQSAGNVTEFFNKTLWTIYIIGSIIFGYRFTHNLLQFRNKIRINKKIASAKHTTVLLSKKTAPHSFLKYIFLNKKEFEEERIAPEILAHEQAHVLQKHSWDILFIEFLQVIFWFNPLLFLLKRSIQTNHEYLADEKVISGKNSVVDYSKLLLNYSAGTHHTSMSSAFNHLSIKKRIIMISKPFSGKRLVARLSLLLPVIAVCLLLFNNKIVAKPNSVETIETSVSQDLFVPKKTSFFEGRKLPNSVLYQNGKLIRIHLKGDQISLNGEEATLKNFSVKLNKLTAEWTDEEIRKAKLNIQISNSTNLREKLNQRYLKTRFAEVRGGDLIPPAPPAPPRIENLPLPPVPPSPDDMIKDELRRAGTKERVLFNDSVRIQQIMEKRLAVMQEKEKRMQQLQEKMQQKQQEIQQKMQDRLQTTEEMRATMEERKRELEQRMEEVENKAENLRESVHRD